MMNCVIQLLKLLINNDRETADNDQLSQLREVLHKESRTAKDAIKDYLIKVFKYACG
jgi:hypothetical protein